MSKKTEQFTDRQILEEAIRRLEVAHVRHGGNNLRMATIKAKDALTYYSRWEDPKSPERLTDGEMRE